VEAVNTVAVISMAAAVVAAIAAIGTGAIAARTLQQQRNDSIERSRPMVAAELRAAPEPSRIQMLVIKNYGQTIARDVEVDFNPPIPDDPRARVLSFMKQRYVDPIPVLTPGMELDGVWYMLTSGAGNQLVSAEPTPNPCTVTVAYKSSDGTQYSDAFPLDITILAKRTWASETRS
jgi:hypothetical protein